MRRIYAGAWIGLAILLAYAFLAPGPVPLGVRQLGGLGLLALMASWPLLHVLEIYARRRMDPATAAGDDAVCAFCGRAQGELEILMVGPERYICARCVQEASTLLRPADAPSGGASLRCSFCQAERPVGSVLVRDSASICNECATLAADHVATER